MAEGEEQEQVLKDSSDHFYIPPFNARTAQAICWRPITDHLVPSGEFLFHDSGLVCTVGNIRVGNWPSASRRAGWAAAGLGQPSLACASTIFADNEPPPRRAAVGNAPTVTITRGVVRKRSSASFGRQASTSARVGFLLAAGQQRTRFARPY